jgi:hypothetical protein
MDYAIVGEQPESAGGIGEQEQRSEREDPRATRRGQVRPSSFDPRVGACAEHVAQSGRLAGSPTRTRSDE